MWEDELSAKRALAGLRQQPVALLSERGEEEEEEVGGGTSQDESLLSSEQEEEGKEENMEEAEKEEESGEGGGKGEVEGKTEGQREDVQWWLTPSHPRAKQLLLRQATTGDLKKLGSARQSRYYRKYGNPNTPRRSRATDPHRATGPHRATDLRYVYI